MKTDYTQYSACLQDNVWGLNTFGPVGIERHTFDSCWDMANWIDHHMAEIEMPGKGRAVE